MMGKKVNKRDIVDVTVVSINPDLTVNILHSGNVITRVQCYGKPKIGNAKAFKSLSFYAVIQ